jgi:hypothetical protein
VRFVHAKLSFCNPQAVAGFSGDPAYIGGINDWIPSDLNTTMSPLRGLNPLAGHPDNALGNFMENL